MADQEIIAARGAIVAKSNDLIQRSRFTLSTQQQKIVLYLISKIQPDDKEFKRYQFSIVEFCRVCGIDYSSGKNYKDVRKAIKDLHDKSIWVTLPDGRETLISWINKAYIEENNGVIEIRLDEDLRPYLLDLKRNYTQYELIYTLHFRSKYTIRLYELIQSIHFNTLEEYRRVYSLEELRGLLDAEGYRDYKNFKARVLLPAVKEINQYSEKILDFDEYKKGKTVKAIGFTVKPKSTEEVIHIQAAIERDLDGVNGLDQLSIFDREEI